MLLADGWKDYELIDSGGAEKLERWGGYLLRRPDPQAIWPRQDRLDAWDCADAVYARSSTGGGRWEQGRGTRLEGALGAGQGAGWEIGYGSMRLRVSLMRFKHTGVFPEQAPNWTYIADMVSEAVSRGNAPRVLNLFAYTGGATVAAALAGATVCHVDSSKGMVARAKENAELSGAPRDLTRYIVDDVCAFVAREARRGKRYDAVVMDPPAYGRGPGGELWEVETGLFRLVEACSELLSDEPVFFLLSSYASGVTPQAAANVLRLALEPRLGGHAEGHELCLRDTTRGIALPCGCCARWSP